MSPLLRPGDQVEVEWFLGAPPEDLRLGELVLARDPEAEEPAAWTLHRVVGFRGQPSLVPLVKGDASGRFDSFESLDIWGRAISLRTARGMRLELTAGRIDRLIARLSRHHRWEQGTIPRLRAALLRRLVFALGSLRRVWS